MLQGPKPRVRAEQVLTAQALGARATAFHHHKAAILVCGLAFALIGGAAAAAHSHPSRFWTQVPALVSAIMAGLFAGEHPPPEPLVSDYLRHIAFDIASYKEKIRAQILRLRINGLAHETEGTDLAEHLVIGPKGVWLHSHLCPFPYGHGTLLEVERDPAGQPGAVNVLIEEAAKRVWDIPRYFFAVDGLTQGRSRRGAILSAAKPFVNIFRELLGCACKNKDSLLISQAMGRGITPGTEAAWVMEPVEDWNPETGLWMDEPTGWVFLRADKDRESIHPADEAVFILRAWARMIDRRMNELIHVPLQAIPRRIDRETLPTLIPWVESLRYCRLSNRGYGRARGDGRVISPEEIAYVISLIQEAQADPGSKGLDGESSSVGPLFSNPIRALQKRRGGYQRTRSTKGSA